MNEQNYYPGLREYAGNANLRGQITAPPAPEDLALQRIRTGIRIRRERLLWGMTQEQLSGILGISANYLGQIERGNRELSRKMEDRICELFHLDRNDLHNAPDYDIPTRLSEDSFLFPDLNPIDLNRLIASCTPSELAICGPVLRYLLLCLRKPAYSQTDPEEILDYLLPTAH